MTKWFDKAGFVHDKPINENGLETSENGPLFTAVLHSLTGQWMCPEVKSLIKSKRQFQATPISGFKTSHFSFDNMLGLYYLLNRSEKLPILWWWSEGKPYIRTEAIFFFVLQYPRLGKIFYPYLRMAMRRSLAKPVSDTNGKHKWWLRCQMLPVSFLEEATYLMEEMYTDSWLGVFRIYYRFQEDHPIIKAASERW